MKITKESDDIYTRNVTVEMTEAEWEFIIGLAAAYAVLENGTQTGSAANRLANSSKQYWEKNLDCSKLF